MAEGVLMPKEGITVESCIIGEWKKNEIERATGSDRVLISVAAEA